MQPGSGCSRRVVAAVVVVVRDGGVITAPWSLLHSALKCGGGNYGVAAGAPSVVRWALHQIVCDDYYGGVKNALRSTTQARPPTRRHDNDTDADSDDLPAARLVRC